MAFIKDEEAVITWDDFVVLIVNSASRLVVLEDMDVLHQSLFVCCSSNRLKWLPVQRTSHPHLNLRSTCPV